MMGNSFLPFVGMLMVVLAQVSGIILNKKAMSRGLSEFILLLYCCAISSLILLPSAFLIHSCRSERPPLSLSILSSIFFLALIGCCGLLMGYAGLQYTSPALNTAMLNIIPAFTFLLALIFRMEKFKWRTSSSQAKSVGTVVSIAGAFILTFYKGSPLIKFHTFFGLTDRFLFLQQSNWILGGFLLAAESFSTSLWYILQLLLLKKYPAMLLLIAFYCFFETIQTALISLVMVKDLSSWMLQPDIRLVAVLYSGIGNVFRYWILTWCLQRKGPVFVSIFKPLSLVLTDVIGVIFLGEALYLGSLIGGVVIVAGFYTVMWGKAKEEIPVKNGEAECLDSSNESSPLLQNKQ
ncbi:WAT1-related protein At3g28050 isoform X1 [Ziziphus jujuba]|uniref:WAT1-related protein n=1 Tax=Ziziphus jujuba TaxID=326968 RepID=A0ABM3ZZ25_ZIZJJ|nr:WAT1-related protein At3g28050 isoform X1 [Ziziphus jujuba]